MPLPCINAELVDNLLAKIGEPRGIQFVQPSTAAMQSYEHGKWLYNIHGIAVEVFRWGRNRDVWSQEGYIPGYHWSDEKEAFELRLEADLRTKILELSDEESSSP